MYLLKSTFLKTLASLGSMDASTDSKLKLIRALAISVKICSQLRDKYNACKYEKQDEGGIKRRKNKHVGELVREMRSLRFL